MNEQDDTISPEQLQQIDIGLASSDEDTHWQAAIALGEFCETDPETIWPLVVKYGSSRDEDTRVAISVCVLEHILQYHFEPFFSRVTELIEQENRLFAHTFVGCWQDGESELPGNSERFNQLQERAWRLWRSQKRKLKLKASLSMQRYKKDRRRRRNSKSA